MKYLVLVIACFANVLVQAQQLKKLSELQPGIQPIDMFSDAIDKISPFKDGYCIQANGHIYVADTFTDTLCNAVYEYAPSSHTVFRDKIWFTASDYNNKRLGGTSHLFESNGEAYTLSNLNALLPLVNMDGPVFSMDSFLFFFNVEGDSTFLYVTDTQTTTLTKLYSLPGKADQTMLLVAGFYNQNAIVSLRNNSGFKQIISTNGRSVRVLQNGIALGIPPWPYITKQIIYDSDLFFTTDANQGTTNLMKLNLVTGAQTQLESRIDPTVDFRIVSNRVYYYVNCISGIAPDLVYEYSVNSYQNGIKTRITTRKVSNLFTVNDTLYFSNLDCDSLFSVIGNNAPVLFLKTSPMYSYVSFRNEIYGLKDGIYLLNKTTKTFSNLSPQNGGYFNNYVWDDKLFVAQFTSGSRSLNGISNNLLPLRFNIELSAVDDLYLHHDMTINTSQTDFYYRWGGNFHFDGIDMRPMRPELDWVGVYGAFDNKILITNTTTGHGSEPWCVPGRDLGNFNKAFLLAEVGPSTASVNVLFSFQGKEHWYFIHDGNPRSIWSSDGTKLNTFKIFEFSSNMTGLLMDGENFYFSVEGFSPNQILYYYNSTTHTCTELAQMPNISGMKLVGNKLFFTSMYGPTSICVTAKTPNTVKVIKEITNQGNTSIYDLTVWHNKVYFTANTTSLGRELWVSDLTDTGTFMLKDITPGNLSSDLQAFSSIDDYVLFINYDAQWKGRLWRSDGTANGTVQVTNKLEITTLPLSFGKEAYFAGITDNLGKELWRTDGTDGGTVNAADIAPGFASSDVNLMYKVGNNILLPATTAGRGREWWLYMTACDVRFNFTSSTSAQSLTAHFTLMQDVEFDTLSSGWVWDFGDGAQSALKSPNHHYDTCGTFKVTLKVVSHLGCTDSLVQYVTVDSTFQIPTTGIDPSFSRQMNSVTVYPNPAGNTAYLQLPENALDAKLKIVNIMGQEVWTDRTSNNRIYSLQTNTFPSGVYMVVLTSGNSVYYGKLVKE